MPVKPEVALVGVVTVPPAPDTMLQEPVPTKGLFPDRVAVVPQIFWSGPAAAVVGVATKVTTTSSVEAAQGKFDIVQRKV